MTIKGQFQGTFTVTGGGVPGKTLLLLVAGVAVAVWIATHILVIGLVLALLIILIAAAAFVLRRQSDRDTEAIARQAAALQAEVEEERQLAAPRSLTVINVNDGGHLHLEAAAPTVPVVRHATVDGAVVREHR